MLVRYFTSSYLGQYILLFVLMAGLWIPSFLAPAELQKLTAIVPLWDIIYASFSNLPSAAVIVSFALVFLSSLLLNSILATNNIIPRNSLLAALIYGLLTSVFREFHQLNPLVFVNFFIIVMFFLYFKLYYEQEAFRAVFSLGFLTALSFLFYPPAIYLLIPLYLILLVMGNLSWRELIIPLIGFSMPLLFTAVYYFMLNKLELFLTSLLFGFDTFALIRPDFQVSKWIQTGLLFCVLIISMIKGLGSLSAKNIDLRKKVLSAAYFLIFCLLVYIIIVFEIRSLLVMMVPVTIIISYYFSGLRKTTTYSIFLWLMIILGVIRNYSFLDF